MQLDDYKEGIKLYNSQNMSDQLVKDNFVVRKRHFDKVWKDISEATMQHPEQHYIVQGVRGSGKTTLLNRLAIEVKEHPELQTHLIPVVMKEEEYGISNLFRFWERVAEELHESNSEFFPEILEQFDELEEADPKKAVSILTSQLKKAEKKIILFIDNLVELFDHFSDFDTALLREILTTKPFVRIIGGSAISLEAFYDNSSPFYQFFKVVKLQGLNKKDTITLLKKLAQYEGEEETLKEILKNNPGKIESIRRLTGGIPRTISILFNVLMEGPKGTTFSMLEDIIDKTTPLYKHRMDDLSKQQKPIIDAIALNWDAMSAKEIKAVTRLESKTISAQLSQLEKQWLVEKVNTDGKNKLYRLKERFFNIWYLMRYGRRKDRRRVKWLTQFMEIWCSKDDLKNRSQMFVEQLKDGGHPTAITWFANAMLCSEHIDVLDKFSVRENTANYLLNSGNNLHLNELFPVIDAATKNKIYVDLRNKLQSNNLDKLNTTQKSYLLKGLNESGDFISGALFSSYLENKIDSQKMRTMLQDPSLSSTIKLVNSLNDNDIGTAIEILDFPEIDIEIVQGIRKLIALKAGLYLYDKQDYQKALFYLEYSTEKESKEETNSLKSICHFHLGNVEEGLKHAELTNPKLKDSSKLFAASLLFEQKDYPNGIKYLLTIHDESDCYEHALQVLILAYISNRQFKEALEAIEKAARLDIKYTLHPAMSAAILSYVGEYEKAADIFSSLLNEDAMKDFEYLATESLCATNKIDSLEMLLQSTSTNQEPHTFEVLSVIQRFGNPCNKKIAYSYLPKIDLSQATFNEIKISILILLWNNHIEEATSILESYLASETFMIGDREIDSLEIFVFFLAKDQTNLVDHWLREYDLTERFKPLYFALMHLMKDKYPNEYLRMGEEYKETVEEILAQIKDTAKKYQ